MSQFKLLTLDTPKTRKAVEFGCLNAVMYLSPGGWRCPSASPGCLKGCLNTAGRGAMQGAQKARKWRTRLLKQESTSFYAMLYDELMAFKRLAVRRELKPVVRLNGTSDLNWTGDYLYQPTIQFVEYTKRIDRVRQWSGGLLPSNLYLNFSRSETNEAECLEAFKLGVNVCVVFNTLHGKPLPKTIGFSGDSKSERLVIDGDVHDLRHLDLKGVVVGLRAKGKARRDKTGFVVRVQRVLEGKGDGR